MATKTEGARLVSDRDLRFLLEEWLDVSELTQRDRFRGQSTEEYRQILELAAQLAADKFAPHDRAADVDPPQIGADGKVRMQPDVMRAVDAFADAGLIGATLDAELGGFQLPIVVGAAIKAWFNAASSGTSNYVYLTAAAANLLAQHGSPEQVQRWVVPMASGRYLGTMAISEPQAGSSLADIATVAEPQPDGTYRITGTKMWISAGEHELSDNIVHLVLARVAGAPPGIRGISLFIVPRWLVDADGAPVEENDVVLAGINHKLGGRGTVNTVLSFGEGRHRPERAAGAVGYLVGEEHHGLSYMFAMMNEARIDVGISACALGYTAYLKALRYARERQQGRLSGSRDARGRQVEIIQHADVRRMLLAQKAYVEGGLALVLYVARIADDAATAPDADARRGAQLLLDLLTPIAKSWPSQWCLEANHLAIQVHGGYGYTPDYDVERHWRDNRINMIYEGTHGIQARDLLGRKVTMQDGAAFAVLREAVGDTIRRATTAGDEASRLAASLEDAMARLAAVTASLAAEPDRTLALANAEIYLEACGHVVVAWMWLEQFLATDGADAPFYEGKRQAARFFFRYELPRTRPQLDLLASLDRTTLDMANTWF